MSRALLKEAIADAKAVKEAAIANAKAALEEAFTPHLKELLASKLESLEEGEMETEGMGRASKMKKAMDEYGMEHPDRDMDGDGDIDADDAAMMKEIDLDEILAELEGDLTEEDTVMEAKEKDSEDDSEEEAEDESESKGKMPKTKKDLEKFIEDIFKEMAESGELGDLGGMEDMGAEEAEADMMGDEEEIDLQELMNEIMNEYVDKGPSGDNALLKAIDDAINKGMELSSEMLKKIKKALAEQQMNEYVEGGPSEENALLKAIDAAISKGIKLSSKVLKAIKKALEQGGGGWQRGGMYEEDMMNEYVEGGPSSENALLKAVDAAIAKGGELAKKLLALLAQGGGGWQRGGVYEEELNEAYSTIKILRSEINEVNLLNAKLLYTNKIFKARNLTESQKVKVLSTFDKATTVKEVKLVFESLNTTIAASNNTAKAPIKESMGFASKASGMASRQNQTIETDAVIARMKKLAGL